MPRALLASAVLAFLFLAYAPASRGEVLYDETFTGAELDARVTLGNASYPAASSTTVSGTRLNISPRGFAGDPAVVMFRMPILEPLTGCQDLTVTVVIDWVQLTGDNDFGIAISDGTWALGGAQGDGQNKKNWSIDSADTGQTLSEDWNPRSEMLYSTPHTYVINAADLVGTSTVHATNAVGSTALHTPLSPIDYANPIDFLLIGNNGGEVYGVKSVSIKAEVAPGGSCGGGGDSDGDGVPDDEDICPGGDDNLDADGDGVPDFCDPCPSDPLNDSDGDGSCDSEDLCLGDDATGDTDGDGVCDDSDPCAGSPNVDTDGDGICDGDDVCTGDDATGDSDGDGVCDDLDLCLGNDVSGDTDGDGTCDDIDACPNDAFNDADDDGVCGDVDNCPNEWNPAQTDTDEDGAGDECDADDDGDGIDDADDNCPLDYNPGQEDFDGDGAGDFCDADDDEDGVQDDVDACAYTAIGDVVAPNGCSIAQLCPCENDWKNHGAYVRCVAHTTNAFVDLELITDEEKDAIMSEAGQSDCGSKK